jgi:hypothetical protein
LAGGLKQELETKYGIKPKVRHAYHELEVLVNDRSVFCYTRKPQIPTVEELLALIENAASENVVADVVD